MESESNAPQSQPTDNVTSIEQQLLQGALITKQVRSGKGFATRIIPCEANACLLLSQHPDWQGVLGLDLVRDKMVWLRPPPAVSRMESPKVGEDYVDADAVYVQLWLGKHAEADFKIHVVKNALRPAARVNAFNPLRVYLEECLEIWRVRGGPPAIDGWTERYLGAKPTPAVLAAGRVWLLQAVARAFDPGCQADYVLVLCGGQGVHKTNLVRAIGHQWHLGALPNIRNRKAAVEACHGKWVCEISEMDAFSKAQTSAVKEFITNIFDNYRKAYDREQTDQARMTVFVGTTNEREFLSDSTGNRRFMPITVGTIDIEAFRRDVALLLGEALHRVRSGEQTWPTVMEQGELDGATEEHFDSDPWEDILRTYLRDPAHSDQDGGVRSESILAGPLDIDPGKQTQKDKKRLGRVLVRLSYKCHVAKDSNGHSFRVWRPRLPNRV